MVDSALAVEDLLAAPRIGRLSNAAWAWEFLRRNPDYHWAYRANRPGMMKPITLKSRTSLIRLRKRFPEAETRRLLFPLIWSCGPESPMCSGGLIFFRRH